MVRNNIKKFRLTKWNLSQAELSDMLPEKPGKTVLSLIENGHALPTPKLMADLCNFFSCKPTDLFNESDLLFEPNNGGDLDEDSIKITFSSEFTEALKELSYNDPEEWLREVMRNLMQDRAIRRVSEALANGNPSNPQSSGLM